MVVKCTVCSPSTPTIRVRIPLMSTVFFVKFVFEKNENKQKEAGVGQLLYYYPYPHLITLHSQPHSGASPRTPRPGSWDPRRDSKTSLSQLEEVEAQRARPHSRKAGTESSGRCSFPEWTRPPAIFCSGDRCLRRCPVRPRPKSLSSPPSWTSGRRTSRSSPSWRPLRTKWPFILFYKRIVVA